MNIFHSEDRASFGLQFAKSNYLAKIVNYKIISFNDSNSDAACIARILEVFTLNKLRAEGEKLYSLTGMVIPEPGAEAEEINLLLKRCLKLCRLEEDELGYRERAASDAKTATQQIYTARSILEMQSRGHQPVSRADAENLHRAALSQFEEQRKRVKDFRALGGLLMEEAKRVGKGVDKPLLHTFPVSLHIPSGLVSDNQKPEISRAARFIMDALDELMKAVREIIKQCSPPADRYDLNNSGMLRAAAYKEYYSTDNILLRAIVTGEEYVNYRVESNRVTERKEKLFSV